MAAAVEVMVTVAALFDTLLTDDVMPDGGVDNVVPADVVYHATVPVSPLAMLVVFTEKIADPVEPALIVPFCVPTDTVLLLFGVL